MGLFFWGGVMYYFYVLAVLQKSVLDLFKLEK